MAGDDKPAILEPLNPLKYAKIAVETDRSAASARFSGVSSSATALIRSSDEEYEFFAQSFACDTLKQVADYSFVLHRV